MSSFFICCLLLGVTGCLTLALENPAADEDDFGDAERTLQQLFGSYDSHRASLVYERKYDSAKESFSWRDCGGRGSVVHLKSLSISPLPLHLPGTVIVGLNASVDSDIEPPISVDMDIKKKVAASWINVCKHVPGGCHLKNICDTQHKHETAAAAAEEEDYGTNPFCQMKKGNFSLPPTPFPTSVKAPSGWYRVTAKFRKEAKLIGCVCIQLNVG